MAHIQKHTAAHGTCWEVRPRDDTGMSRQRSSRRAAEAKTFNARHEADSQTGQTPDYTAGATRFGPAPERWLVSLESSRAPGRASGTRATATSCPSSARGD